MVTTSSNSKLLLPAFGLLALLAFAVGAYLSLQHTRSAAPANAGLLWPDPPALGNFALIDDAGAPLGRDALVNKWTLLFFGFTHCPDVCPTTLATLKQVHEKLQDYAPYRAHGQVLFVSVDPARDTPATLKAYVTYFNPAFRAATGSADKLAQFTRQLGVIYVKVDSADPETYSMDHTASILLLDPQARLVAVFSLPHDAADIANRFRAIADFVGART